MSHQSFTSMDAQQNSQDNIAMFSMITNIISKNFLNKVLSIKGLNFENTLLLINKLK